jgi:hypothetical protein
MGNSIRTFNHFHHLLLLQDHSNRFSWAFVGADAAALAIVQVRGKEAFNLMYAALRAIDLAEAAFDAFLLIDLRHESPPGSSFSGPSRSRLYQFACF